MKAGKGEIEEVVFHDGTGRSPPKKKPSSLKRGKPPPMAVDYARFCRSFVDIGGQKWSSLIRPAKADKGGPMREVLP